MKYLQIQKYIEEVKDIELKEKISEIASNLKIAITCMEESDFTKLIDQCEENNNVKPLRDELRGMIFR